MPKGRTDGVDVEQACMKQSISSSRHIAQVSKEQSRQKLEVKIMVLCDWAENGVPWQTDAVGKPVFNEYGERVLEYYPRSQNQARTWTEADNGAGLQATLDRLAESGKITKEQRQLFTSYKTDIFSDKGRSASEQAVFKQLQASLVAALKDVDHTAKKQLEGENKTSIIQELKRQVARQERMITDTATKYLEAEKRADEAKRRAETAERKRDSLCLASIKIAGNDN